MSKGELAFQIAMLLNDSKDSRFWRNIRFHRESLAPHPIEILCSDIPADLGTSLVGLARVGRAFDPAKAPEWLASVVVAVVKTLQDEAPEMLAKNKVLTPPPEATRGAVNMIVGLAVALAYRMGHAGEESPSKRTKTCLVEAAKGTLDLPASCVRTAPGRRNLLGAFVRTFFADTPGIAKAYGIPEGLIKCLSTSAFGPPPDEPVVTTAPRQLREAEDEKDERILALFGQDPHAFNMGDREIGRRCGMDGKTVKTRLVKLFGEVSRIKKVTRKGKSYLQDGTQIGKSRPEPTG